MAWNLCLVAFGARFDHAKLPVLLQFAQRWLDWRFRSITHTANSVTRTCMSRLGVRILQRTVLLVRWRSEVRIFTQCQNICSLFFPVYQASTDKILREDQPQMRLIRKTGIFDLDLRVLKPICISKVKKIPFRTEEIYYSLLSLRLTYFALFPCLGAKYGLLV